MIRRLTPLAFTPAALGPGEEIIYTVPGPHGKAAGVSGDGRLHLVLATVTPVPLGSAYPTLGLSYYAEDGSLVGRFVDTTFIGSTWNTTGHITWASEPSTSGSTGGLGNPGQDPPGEIGGAGSGGGFRWLLAGFTVGLFWLSATGYNFTVQTIVEDYGGLAAGDEYTSPGRGNEPPAFLFPERD